MLEEVLAETRRAEDLLHAAVERLEEETLEDPQRGDWGNVPALEADDGRETESDAQLRVAINDARDSLAEVEDLVSIMLDGDQTGDTGEESPDSS